ncbi:hypothetical protein [Halostella litorea]|uniref:hypothetical protein n=1 Tax=Halostella litorea TaxID=2528831 RepID=UPI00138699CF|nr:hypothetical protein [Halostella litorea]
MDSPHLHDACPDGEHVIVHDGEAEVCDKCGISLQTIVDALGHDYEKAGGRQ